MYLTFDISVQKYSLIFTLQNYSDSLLAETKNMNNFRNLKKTFMQAFNLVQIADDE